MDERVGTIDAAARILRNATERYARHVAAVFGIPYRTDVATQRLIWNRVRFLAENGEELAGEVLEAAANLAQAQLLRSQLVQEAEARISLSEQDQIDAELRVVMLDASARHIDRRIP